MNKIIYKIIKKWKKEAGVNGVIQWKLCMDKTLKIFTSQPGYLIGKGGLLINKYNKILKKELGATFNRVEFIETSWYWA